MRMLPTSLRARIALVSLLGIFLIPVFTSALRGLTHVLTCTAEIDTTVSVDRAADDANVLLSADSITADEGDTSLCGGIEIDLQLTSSDEDRAEILIEIANTTDVDWQGSVELAFSGTDVPVAIGEIGAGETATDTVTLEIDADRTYEISGTLLLGP
ncbi:MAG: hypothetical protein U5K30_01005 [Acidimicrobiales bacterium]|nr:hypothetical protein [Acidimicrobiales bacterium]